MSDIPRAKFWMVYGVGQREPTMRHAHIADAAREAKRLARLYPDIAFVVLEAVSMMVKRDVDMITFKDHNDARQTDDNIPF